MKNNILFFALLFSSVLLFSQNSITGTLSNNANQNLTLTGFKGFQTYTIDQAKVSANGDFSLKYPENHTGMAILSAGEQETLIVVLEKGGIQLKAQSLMDNDQMVLEKGEENKWFKQYATEHSLREQALSAWVYLKQLYTKESLFRKQIAPDKSIFAELVRIKTEDSLYMANLPDNSYVKWYLLYRGLVSSVQTIAQYRTDEIPDAIARFRSIDFTDPRWQTSGMFKDAIESHIWLIENSGSPLESVFEELNKSIDILLKKLKNHPALLNTVSEHLFMFMEERSLFRSAEYLAVKLLTDGGYKLEVSLMSKLEKYRKMKTGNIAPDIQFGNHTLLPQGIAANRLSELKNDFTLVVFAAGWCPHCTAMMPRIVEKYPAWKKKGVEIVLVSLDETTESFTDFAGQFPFIRTTDLKKWEGKAVRNYDVYATPTLYLLDKEKKILTEIKSVEHMDAWLDQLSANSSK